MKYFDFLYILLLLGIVKVCHSTTEVSFKITNFINKGGLAYKGRNTSGTRAPCSSLNKRNNGSCNTYFVFCFGGISNATEHTCADLVRVGQVYNNTEYLNSTKTFTGNFTKYSIGKTLLIIDIYNKRYVNSMFDVIDIYYLTLNVTAGKNVTDRRTYLIDIHNQTQFTLELSLWCAENYYGPDCSVYCLPDNPFTTCDPDTGQLIQKCDNKGLMTLVFKILSDYHTYETQLKLFIQGYICVSRHTDLHIDHWSTEGSTKARVWFWSTCNSDIVLPSTFRPILATVLLQGDNKVFSSPPLNVMDDSNVLNETETRILIALRINSYSNPSGKSLNYVSSPRRCCDKHGTQNCTIGDTCDTLFTFCFGSLVPNKDDTKSCNGGILTTDVFQDTNTISQPCGDFSRDDNYIEIINNIVVFNSDHWGMSSTNIYAEVKDEDKTTGKTRYDLIDNTTYTETSKPSTHFNESLSTKVIFNNSNIFFEFEFWTWCAPFHYGKNCEIYCKPKFPPYQQCNDSGQLQCIQNWTGENCTISTIYPCQNGGIGIRIGSEVKCHCINGWKGRLCQTDIDECSSNPCLHNGTCINKPGNFTCLCEQGWSDGICATDIDECSDINKNPCTQNGDCINVLGSYKCNCKPGWTGLACDLDINECQNNPCRNGGHCNNTNGNYTCSCSKGWTGTLCDQDINECATNPCLNRGICHNIDGSFKCVCTTGWTGLICDTDINECLNNPCRNGGHCNNTNGNYTCSCSEGWTGTLCDQDINECATNPCLNRGICHNIDGSFKCVCTTGWTGLICDTDINECLNDPCRNGGHCNNTIGNYTCSCSEGWTGTNCEQDINECATNPCLNQGTCSNTVGSFKCACSIGWTGTFCESNINECDISSPCLNQGTCHDTNGSYSCVCSKGWSGQKCETDINECITNPCLHQATCINTGGSFECICDTGWTGLLCDTNINECNDASICKHKGTCHDTYGGFVCICPSGWTGLHCESDINECIENPCEVNSACVNTNGSYNCICSYGYTGAQCQTKINKCTTTLCVNGGTCHNNNDSFVCQCVAGFTGNYCANSIDNCQNHPCRNNGSCINRKTDYKCACGFGWTGRNCELDINECDKQKCFNNGSCLNSPGSYKCICTKGWQGYNCEEDIDECSKPSCHQGHSICQNSPGSFRCHCDAGFTGIRCDDEIPKTTFITSTRQISVKPSTTPTLTGTKSIEQTSKLPTVAQPEKRTEAKSNIGIYAGGAAGGAVILIIIVVAVIIYKKKKSHDGPKYVEERKPEGQSVRLNNPLYEYDA